MLVLSSVIPHDQQRYPTTGDWFFDDPSGADSLLHIRTSRMGNRDYEFLVQLHEQVEAWLCRAAGVSEREVSAFDRAYEEAREQRTAAPCGCVPTDESEPGDDVHAPYYHQHQFATSIERQTASRLGVDWAAYEAANLKLYETDGQ